MPFDILDKNIKMKSEEQMFYDHQLADRKSCILTSQTVVEHPADRQLIPKNLDLDYVEQLYTESSSKMIITLMIFSLCSNHPKGSLNQV